MYRHGPCRAPSRCQHLLLHSLPYLREALVVADDRPGLKARLPKSDRRAQAAVMMMQRLTEDVTTKELAASYGISERTVERRLADARENEVLVRHIQTVFVQDLLPRSLVVLKEALEGDDKRLAVTVAMKVVDGLKAMTALPDIAAQSGQEDSLEVFRAKLTRRPARSTADAVPPDGADVIDVDSAPPDEATHSSQPPEAGPAAASGIPFRAPDSTESPAEPAQDSPSPGESGSESGS